MARTSNEPANEPDNPASVFQLAHSYFDRGYPARALETYRKREAMGGWLEEVFSSSYRVAVCYQRLNREEEMVAQLLQCFERFPHRAEPLHMLALHYQRQKQHRLAYHIARIGVDIPLPTGGLYVEPEVYSWRLADIVAVSLYWLGRWDEALMLNRSLLGKVPEAERPRILSNMDFCGVNPSLQPPPLPATLENGVLFLRSEHARHPLRCRPNSSDPCVFRQIFIEREYACLDDVPAAGLIVDCGAYVGYSAAYFLTRFPGCKLIAVEPDPANFELLCRNLVPYGASAQAIAAGVWSRPVRLALAESPYRDGREWSRHIRVCPPDEPGGFPAVDIGGLLARSGHDRISILKIDIEGAEAQVFSENHESWIDRVDNLVIELHDDSPFGNAPSIFQAAIAGRGFTVSQFGELTVCKRR